MAESRERSEWNRLSSLLALIANCHRDPKKHSSARPEQFNPYARCDRCSELTRRRRAKAPLTLLKDIWCNRNRKPVLRGGD
mgnify:CR=1 FL=1